jgi:hypothetical protein
MRRRREVETELGVSLHLHTAALNMHRVHHPFCFSSVFIYAVFPAAYEPEHMEESSKRELLFTM